MTKNNKMVVIRPFRAIRPVRDKAHLVASRSYITYSSAQLNEKLLGNPYTFIHIINPDFADQQKTKPASKGRLLKIRKRFEQFLAEGVYHKDKNPSLYIYRQIKNGNDYTGIIGCASIDDYFNDAIKKHEQTLTKREETFKEYLKICDFNAEPVCFVYPENKVVESVIKKTLENRPEYDFTTTDQVRHSLWLISGQEDIQTLVNTFDKIPCIYIADGHHRSASSALLGKEMREQNPGYTGKENFNFFMGLFMSEKHLKVYDYNRVVKDLDGYTPGEFLEEVKKRFIIKKDSTEILKPGKLHEFSMYFQGKWFLMEAKSGNYDDNHPVKSLDSHILTEHLLLPVLGIKDLKNDNRIEFIAGDKGLAAIQQAVDKGKVKVGFALYPVTIEQLKKVSDAGLTMPPKSTWVEPKLRSGLTIYSLDLS